MKTLLLVIALLGGWSTAFAAEDAAKLYVPDGQILAIPVKVYVTSTNLDMNMKPRLQLAGFKAISRTNITHLKEWEPFVVAPNQTWTEMVEGQSVQRKGTLLMFDLNQFELDWYKATSRTTPVLSWQPADYKDGGRKPTLVGGWVYLGRRWTAGGWTLITVGLLAFGIARMAIVKKQHMLYLISGHEGYMSLWRTQLAAWTIAVGSMVFLFGLIQFDVPRIPESLVVLMGMSVVTGSLSAIASKSQPVPKANPPAAVPAAPAAPVAAVGTAAPAPAARWTTADKPRWSDLISGYNPEIGRVVLSVPKAQMIFWTGIILVLFVVKSLLRGELWEVPWELVTLTGVSQAGYVGDKAIQRKRQD